MMEIWQLQARVEELQRQVDNCKTYEDSLHQQLSQQQQTEADLDRKVRDLRTERRRLLRKNRRATVLLNAYLESAQIKGLKQLVETALSDKPIKGKVEKATSEITRAMSQRRMILMARKRQMVAAAAAEAAAAAPAANPNTTGPQAAEETPSTTTTLVEHEEEDQGTAAAGAPAAAASTSAAAAGESGDSEDPAAAAMAAAGESGDSEEPAAAASSGDDHHPRERSPEKKKMRSITREELTSADMAERPCTSQCSFNVPAADYIPLNSDLPPIRNSNPTSSKEDGEEGQEQSKGSSQVSKGPQEKKNAPLADHDGQLEMTARGAKAGAANKAAAATTTGAQKGGVSYKAQSTHFTPLMSLKEKMVIILEDLKNLPKDSEQIEECHRFIDELIGPERTSATGSKDDPKEGSSKAPSTREGSKPSMKHLPGHMPAASFLNFGEDSDEAAAGGSGINVKKACAKDTSPKETLPLVVSNTMSAHTRDRLMAEEARMRAKVLAARKAAIESSAQRHTGPARREARLRARSNTQPASTTGSSEEGTIDAATESVPQHDFPVQIDLTEGSDSDASAAVDATGEVLEGRGKRGAFKRAQASLAAISKMQ